MLKQIMWGQKANLFDMTLTKPVRPCLRFTFLAPLLVLSPTIYLRLFDMLGSIPWYVSSHTTINLTLSVGEETNVFRDANIELRA